MTYEEIIVVSSRDSKYQELQNIFFLQKAVSHAWKTLIVIHSIQIRRCFFRHELLRPILLLFASI